MNRSRTFFFFYFIVLKVKDIKFTPNLITYVKYFCISGHLCDEDIDECAISSPCRNGATCINTNGSYTCSCAKGYEGRDCLINTDDCRPCKFKFLTPSFDLCSNIIL